MGWHPSARRVEHLCNDVPRAGNMAGMVCGLGLWQQSRAAIRKAFFHDLRSTLRKVPFPHWRALLGKLLHGLPEAVWAALA